MTPITAYAADNSVIKEQVFTASADTEREFAGHVDFAEAIIEGGKTYQLSDITYKVLSKKYLDKKKKNVDSEVVEAGNTYTPEQTITDGGITYKLQNTIQERQTVENAYEQTVFAFEDYRYVISPSDVPDRKVVQATNDKTGQVQDVNCTLTGISSMGMETFTNYMTVTYSDYDSAYYEWNGNLIPRNDDMPALAGYENQLLNAAGAGAGSTITDISWTGDTYQDENGVICRDATATVQQVGPVYRANYNGRIYVEAREGTVYHMTYEGEDPEGRVEYKVQATANYVEQKVPALPYILAGIGIVIVLAAIVGMLMILSKKQKEKRENELWKI